MPGKVLGPEDTIMSMRYSLFFFFEELRVYWQGKQDLVSYVPSYVCRTCHERAKIQTNFVCSQKGSTEVLFMGISPLTVNFQKHSYVQLLLWMLTNPQYHRTISRFKGFFCVI
jgi:hypothetical protein